MPFAKKYLVAAVVATALVCTGTGAAYADDHGGANVEPAALQASLDDSASAELAAGDVISTVDDVSVVVPDSLDHPIVISSEGSVPLEVALPGEAVSSSADAGTASVTHTLKDGGAVVPVVRSDGTVQVLSVMNSVQDPTSYSYDFSSAQGSTVTVLPDGSAIVSDTAGEELATIAVPWAVDNAGASVPTHFVALGSTLTQIVEPSGSSVYPIVADPALTVTSYQYEAVNVYKTSNWTNKSKQLGVCNVLSGAGGGTCTISVTKSVGTTISTEFGLSASDVASKIGISATKSVSVTVQWTSPAAPVGSSFKAWAVGTRVTYNLKKWKVSKAGGLTAKTLISTSGTLTSFSPVSGFSVGQ